MPVAVLGCGSWGVALAKAFSYVCPVVLWGRNATQIEQIKNTDRILPKTVCLTNDFSQIRTAELIVIATSTNGLREVLANAKELYDSSLPDIIWACKGLESGSDLFPHQIIAEITANATNVGALLGPSFAKEVLLGLPTAITLASQNLNFATKWINIFKGIPNFRIYANTDVIGSEAGAAVKNIMAIAVGISDGLHLGGNARAALITRSLNELSLLVLALGGAHETIYGLTGIGDLILTCTGDLSRNRNVGLKLAQGMELSTILDELGHVAEGVNALAAIYRLSKSASIEMPIVNAVYDVINNQANLQDVVKGLLSREPKAEFMHSSS